MFKQYFRSALNVSPNGGPTSSPIIDYLPKNSTVSNIDFNTKHILTFFARLQRTPCSKTKRTNVHLANIPEQMTSCAPSSSVFIYQMGF